MVGWSATAFGTSSPLGAVTTIEGWSTTASSPITDKHGWRARAASLDICNMRGPMASSKMDPKIDMNTTYNLAAPDMNSLTCSRLPAVAKNFWASGTGPRAPWIVARGRVDRKQKIKSGTNVSRLAFRQFLHLHGCQSRVPAVTRNMPTKRQVTPTKINGNTCRIRRNTLVSVLLPIMLNKMICPKTQTPPTMRSRRCIVSWSTMYAKKDPVTMTSSSGWNIDPGLKPIGTTAWSPKPPRATAKIMRYASTSAPVKNARPFQLACVRRGISQPAREPSSAPARPVAIILQMFAITRTVVFTEGCHFGSAKPFITPNNVKAYEASNGANMNTNRGMGCCGNWRVNSPILGMTRPSPRQNKRLPNTAASTQVYPMNCAA
mmetsp:Transcript_71245/g.206600  ORF Transcript_71245/g.206600 Transcript_71245/m.206600 type:complete len:377 (-) Transcript_71245:391-1521(-)